MKKSKIHYSRPSGLCGVELLSCPDAEFDFPPHFHQANCIWFNISGGEHYSHRAYTEILQSGSFGIVAPGEVHANRAFGHSARSLMTFYVHDAQLQSVVRQVGGTSSADVEFQTRFYRDSQCLELLVGLFGILRHSTSVLERESAFLEVFSLLTERHAVARTQEQAIGKEKTRVRWIIDLFQDRLAENISLNELAQRCDYTPFHLIRFFKRECWLSPHAYLLRLRLERARELIWQGRPLVHAALETGFADQSHLTRLFKAHYGISPGEFRRQILCN